MTVEKHVKEKNITYVITKSLINAKDPSALTIAKVKVVPTTLTGEFTKNMTSKTLNLQRHTMKKFKFATAAIVLTSAFSASAMQAIDDSELSQMTARDGASIVADMKLNIGAATYKNSTSQAGASLNGISATGFFSAAIDMVTGAAYNAGTTAALKARGIADANVAAVISGINTATGYVANSDVVQISFPLMPTTAKGALLNVAVASINTGNNGASMGGLTLSDINFGGSKVWIHGH